jgi:hypothetical protein
MANPDDKEIQKTIEEMNKRVADFHAEKMYSPEDSSPSFYSSNLKLILTIVGVIIVLILSAVFYMKSSGKIFNSKNPGLETFKNAPPWVIPPELLKAKNK